jgi:hypothetical protein
LFARYREGIVALPAGELSRNVLLDGRFELHDGESFSVHYAPFDHVNGSARVVIVGLTPGWQQMRLAFEVARDRLQGGSDDDHTLRAVKQEASFAGMRNRLAEWLDGIGLQRALGLTSAAELFGPRADLLQTISAARYPVLMSDGRNWSGGNPSISQPALRHIVRRFLAPELAALDGALVVPLGVAVQTGLRRLVAEGRLTAEQCLFGFPHPSGRTSEERLGTGRSSYGYEPWWRRGRRGRRERWPRRREPRRPGSPSSDPSPADAGLHRRLDRHRCLVGRRCSG